MATKTLLTAEEYRRIPDRGPSELVRGEVIEMSPPSYRHGVVCVNVSVALKLWARSRNAGSVAGNDAGVMTERNPDTVRGADVQFISRARLPGGYPDEGYPAVPPDLAVEVISPSDRWTEVVQKVDEYLEAGVLEVWLVEPQNEFVEVYRADQPPVRFEGDELLTSEKVLPGFQCVVRDFFVRD
jgi:Uma2 family endonuclease